VKQREFVANGTARQAHVYSVCFFDRDFVVPDVLLIDAASDEEALAEARLRRQFTTREVWNRHRLVGVIQPSQPTYS
jgi:hypothetical protein